MQVRIGDRWVASLALSQMAVYADVLEGAPDREINERFIERFRSHDHARDPEAFGSEACVVWFQEAFAFPIAPEVERAMRALDWVAIARDRST